MKTIIDCVNEWQTLIAGLIALAAAIWTIWAMRGQTRSEERRHTSDLKRKAFAARAQMPDALSGLCTYIRAVCNQILEGGDKPEAPIAEMAILKGVIEHIDEHEAAKTFTLVSWYQVQHARFVNRTKPKKVERDDLLYDAILLHAYVNDLFDYARNEAESSPQEKPTREAMMTAYKNAINLVTTIAKSDEMQGVLAIIQRRHT